MSEPPKVRSKRVTAAAENAQRRSDMLFLRQGLARQTPSAPFDPRMKAPHCGLPLWQFAHAVAWQGHERSAAAKRAAADNDASSDSSASVR
jgi:hypothetical protein